MALAGFWDWGGEPERKTPSCPPEASSSQGQVHLVPALGLTPAMGLTRACIQAFGPST